jgi:hypothetical protein
VSLVTAQYALGTAATQVAGPDVMAQFVTIHNDNSNQQVFVGNESVTINSGFHIDGKEEHTFTLYPGDSLYAVSAGSDNISVIVQKQR